MTKSGIILAFRNSRVKLILSLAFILAALQFGSPVRAQQNVIAIQGGTLIDGNGGTPLQDALIVIEGNRIKSISQGGTPPAGARVIDAHGKYVVPGLWDTHTHFREWFPELLITNGITSVLGYGGGPWLNSLSEGTAKNKIYGPRFFLSQGSFGGSYMIEDKDMIQSFQLKGREDAIQHVRALKNLGSKIIKVYTSTTPDQLKAITDEAHRQGLKVSGHIGISAKEAAMNGIDSLAHATGMPIPDMLKPADLDKLSDMRVIDSGRLRVNYTKIGRPWDKNRELWGPNTDLTEFPLFIEDPRRIMAFGLMDRGLATDLIKLLVQKHVYIESCMGYTFRNVHDRVPQYRAEDEALLNDPNLAYVPERYRDNILDYSIATKFHPDELELMKKGYHNFQWFTKTFIEAGGKVHTGMDTSSPYHATMMPGVAVPREMQLLVDSGVPPMTAIMAATKWPAELLQQTKDLGTLEAGKLADLLILARDPLQDITAYKNIEVVMKDGIEMQRGYHANFRNPLPDPEERDLTFPDWIGSEIPTRIVSISPTAVPEDGPAFKLTVKGHEFVSSSIIQFGDTRLETEFVSPSELRATVPAELAKTVGTYPVQVVHRLPAWGKTNKEFLLVKYK